MNNAIVIVNFKATPSAVGAKSVELAKICDEVASTTGADIRVCVQAMDFTSVKSAVSIPVYAQHVDAITPGSHTGHQLPDLVKEYGGAGALCNHSEHRVGTENVTATAKACEAIGLPLIICAENAEETGELSNNPCEFVAYEPPDLIGGDVSVSTAAPDVITKAVELANAPVLVGAGVKNRQDVEIALQLGAKGVLLASGVTKVDNPREVLLDLIGVDQ